MITLQFRGNYWTVCVDGQGVMSFASLEVAMERVPEAAIVFELVAA